jgi:hypothetical protein
MKAKGLAIGDDRLCATVTDMLLVALRSLAKRQAVTWKNLDGEPHTVVSPDGVFRSHALDQGDTFAFKFDTPGTYKYICSIHPKMMAAIVVQ